MTLFADGVPAVELDTTGTTVTTLGTVLIAPNQVYVVKGTAFGVRQSDGAAYISVKEATYQTDSVGTVSLVGTVQNLLSSLDGLLALLGLAGPQHTLEIVGGNVVQRVKGTTGATFHWGGMLEYKGMQHPD